MNQQIFEKQLAAELQKFGCEYTVSCEDVMQEFAVLDAREQAVILDPEDLALVIVNNINEAGFMELVHTAVRTAVMDKLAEKSSVDRTAWDEAMSSDDEALLAEMIKNGRDQEVLYG